MNLLLLWERLVVFCLPISFKYILPFLFHKGSPSLGQRPAICCIKHTAHSFRILCLVMRVRIQVYFRPEQHNPPEAVELSLSNCELTTYAVLTVNATFSKPASERALFQVQQWRTHKLISPGILFAGRALVYISYLTWSNVGLIIITFFSIMLQEWQSSRLLPCLGLRFNLPLLKGLF